MNDMERPIAIIGYSGHAYVVIDALQSAGKCVTAYCDGEKKAANPFALTYLGRETEAIEELKQFDYFASVGDNRIRRKIAEFMESMIHRPAITVIHPSAVIAQSVQAGHGVLVCAGALINPLAVIGNGAICNTGAIVEHECRIGEYVHIAPGAVLCGAVNIGNNTFVGANSVIRQGITIGANVIIGAGSVVTKDIPDGAQVIGNPAR